MALSSCRHGATGSESECLQRNKAIAECKEYQEREIALVRHCHPNDPNLGRMESHARYMSCTLFWTHHDQAHLLDMDLYRFFLSSVAGILLKNDRTNGDRNDAYTLLMYAILVKDIIDQGGPEGYMERVSTNDMTRENSDALKEIVTEGGFRNYVARNITCTCLDGDAQHEMKQERVPNKSRCANCRQEENSKMTLRACSGCKLVEYCDEKCQVADWNNHRAFCKHHRQKT